MKLSAFFNKTKAGLQTKMTLYVTSAVLIVSAVALLIIASLFRKEYERELNDRFSEAIASTTQFFEQKMANIETATRTVSELASLQIGNKSLIDTILTRALSSMVDVQGVAVGMIPGYVSSYDKYFERCAWLDAGNMISLGTFMYEEAFKIDSAWLDCYGKGNSGWEGPVTSLEDNMPYVGCYTPLRNEKGERIGVVYSYMLVSSLTSMVTKYKARKDMDVSVYSEDGEMVVAPDDYILKLTPEERIVQERTIESLGWKLVFSADRNVIDGRINKALLVLSILILLLFFTISAAIMLTVRYVAKPFVVRQQQTEREKAVMDNEMQLAAGVQNDLVPHEFPPFPGRDEIDLYACLLPARKVGGDMYDYFLQDDKLHFCIGDVSGKGVQASLFMAAMHYLFRSVAASISICEAVGMINRSLCAGNPQCMFVTFWYGCLDLKNGVLEYVNAGHNSPVLAGRDGAEYMPLAENMPLGVLEDAEFVSSAIKLNADDVLFLYTDGIPEAMDVSGREFGTEKTLEAVSLMRNEPSSVIVGNILAEVQQYASDTTQSDDITMLCLKIKNNK